MTKRILAYIVLSILIAEATLRVTVFLGDYLQRNTFLSSLKEEGHGKQMFENLGIHPLGWRLIPGEYGGISINQLRFRGAAPKTPKPSNTFRVAVLGDSEAFGMNLQESETVPGILQTMLQQRDVHAEVLNLGVPGYGLDQYLLQLRETALSLEPDVVVLYLNFNDLDLKRRVFFLPESGIAKYSYLARLFKLIQSGTLLTRGSTAESLTSLYQSLPSLPTFPRAI
ncbi:MAG: SGNH/GDSL hydrolase family protein, partial [Bdellovibrionales bacterium]|nr:SGNH/GDSL hydrolase family protein [Bdellovibrionales bacterium]